MLLLRITFSYDENGRDKDSETYAYPYSNTENGCRHVAYAVYDVLTDLEKACNGFAIICWFGRSTASVTCITELRRATPT